MVDPVPPSKHFSFYVSPCTLVFTNATDLKISIEAERLYSLDIQILDLHLIEKTKGKEQLSGFLWDMETDKGHFQFESSGFKQYVRKEPKHIQSQCLSLNERGGISLDKMTYTQKQQRQDLSC